MATPISTNTARLFVAIELPDDILAVLGTIQEQTRANLGSAANLLRWSRPEGIHLTLQFLGDVPVARIQAIEEALQAACRGIAPFSLEVGGLGAFPNMRRPRVVWVGLAGDTEAALQLAGSVHAGLEPLGYHPDKDFSPHMTIARVREGAQAGQLAPLTRVLSLTDEVLATPTAFTVGSISLMQSRMQAGGSVYTQHALVRFLQGK